MIPQKTKRTFFSTKHGAAAAAVGAATVITLFVAPFRSDAIYFPFLTAVVFSSLYGGWRLGILATTLLLFIGSLFIFNDNQNTATTEWFILLAFGLASGFTVLLCHNQMTMEMARLAAEAKYRTIFEDAITGIYETTLDGRYVAANPKLAQIIGFDSPESMIRDTLDLGQTFYVEPNRRAKFIELVKEKENLVAFESEICRRGGEKIWVSENALAVRDETGKLTGFQGTTIDITDRKRAEAALLEAQEQLEIKVAERTRELAEANEVLRAEIVERMRVEAALRQSEEKFRANVEVSSDCTWELDMDGRYTFISPQIQNLLGYEVDELLGKRPYILMSPEEARRIIDYLKPIAAVRQNFSFMENVNIHKTGELVITETSGVPIFDQAGEFVGYRGVVRNITERKRAEQKLKASEKRYRELVENARDVIYTHDLDGNFTSLNRRGEELFDCTREEVEKLKTSDFIAPEHLQYAREKTEAKLKGEDVTVYEIEAITRGGRKISVEVSSWLIYDESGAATSVQGIARDITERKHTAELLRRSEEKFRNLVETTTDWIWETDRNAVYTYASPQIKPLLGYEPEEILGKRPYDLMPPEEVARLKPIIRELTGAKKGLKLFESVQLHKYGSLITTETSSVAFYDDAGDLIGSRGIARDTTERNLAKDALRESEFRLSSVVTAAPVVLFALNAQGIFTLSEGNGLQLLGLQGGEVVGKSIYEIYRDFPDLLADIRGVLQGEFFAGTIVLGDLTFESRFTPILDENGSVTEIIGVSIDITERKRIEIELVESQKQLRRLSAHLESVREEERKYIARELHDELGQTLTALKIDLTRLSEKKAKLPNETIIGQLYERIPAMIAIVDTAMETTRRIVTALRPGVLDELGFAAALEWQVQDFQKRVGVKCELNIDFEEKKLQPTLNTALFRILQECLTNIARHAAARRVKIELKERDGFLTLTIEDDGRGIGKQKLVNTKSFGISGMRERAILLDGVFEISRPEKGGTRITVKIPVSNDWSDF